MGNFRLLLLFLCVWLTNDLMATHNRAGEITIRQTGDLTIEATVVTYTKTSSTQADRDSVLVYWGDGSSEFVYRVNGNGTPLANNRKLNLYVASHTYPGRATYNISMMDPNRNGGILNVNPPNSEGVPFYIEATYTFLNPQFQGYNNTAILLQPPIDFACVGKRYIHNPNAFDPDGDSLAFELIVPLQDSGLNVPNYIHPPQIEPGPDNIMSLDPITGDLIWDAPQIAGEYNIAFRVNEYRDGVLISSFIRDMQILVLVCENNPPEIETIEEVCAVAGEPINITINISDPDLDQKVKVSASGGPFALNENKAVLDDGPGGFQDQPFQAFLQWTPACEQIREQPYTVVIKAVDDFLDTTGLVDLFTIRIKVIGPPPQGLDIEHGDETLALSWDLPYSCDTADNGYFKGFSVWKRTGSNQFQPDSCETGLEGRGYTKIVANWKGTNAGRYFFEDADITDDGSYCYRILAEFALTTPSGQPYLRVVSIPSDEVCLRAKGDQPLITQASVEATDVVNGVVRVKWIPPDPMALDTTIFTGPYRYQLMRADDINGSNFQPIAGASFTAPFFGSLKDTMFVDQNLDTRSRGYRYRMDFYTGNSPDKYGSSSPASTVFLTTLPSDESAILSWAYDTPWDNYSFEIWRSDQGSPYVLVGTTTEDSYVDKMDIINGLEYCYKIFAFGDYGLDMVPAPLMNFSQESCTVPEDNVAPCAPLVSVTNICDEADPDVPADAFVNYVKWTMPCSDMDVGYYLIYFSEVPGGPYQEVGAVDEPLKSFEHKPGETIAGCYTVVAIDLAGNVSEPSMEVCVQNCPVYKLPNAFTPNGDGQNDFFRPYSARFIETVQFNVFNRWGQLVFTTSDPMINWDGKNNNGKDVSDGVYYYTCEAYEKQNLTPLTLSGYIELIRG